MLVAELSLLQGIVERGLIFSLIVCGVYLTSRIIQFDDLSVEGSFGLGGALMARCMLSSFPLFISMPLTLLAGAIAGCVTGVLHTKLKLNNLISGIVVTTALFSINLKIAGSNVSLNSMPTLFDYLPLAIAPYKYLVMLLMLCTGLIALVWWFLHTEIGYLFQATGNNPQMLTNLGKNKDAFKILGLVVSNALTALAGALFVQYVGYFSIWASVGILITSLAGLILAEQISMGFVFSIIAGACAYQSIIALTFELNFDQEWNKLITALLIVALLALKQRSQKN